MDALLQRVSRLEGSLTPSIAMAQTGISSAFHVSTPFDSWVIDSGATDHMLGTIQSFQSFADDKNLGKVKLANGTLTTISGKGNIQLSPSLTTSSILHVPDLSSKFIVR